MSATTAPALFVIERPTDMDEDSPWQKVDEAWTPKQAERKRDQRLKSAAMDHRTVDVVIIAVANWADQFNPEKPFDLAPPAPPVEAPPPPTVLDDIRERNATGGVAAPEAASVAAAPAIEKIHFECGNILRDVHTGAEIRVTAVYDSETHRGFDWETLAGPKLTGFCPAIAVQYFEFVEKERVTAAAEEQPPAPPAPAEPEKPAFPEWPPCPFLEKDILRDIHTNVEVRVKKVFLPSRAGLAFKWETLDKKDSGTCPIASLSCFVLVKREPSETARPHQPEPAREALAQPDPAGLQPGPIDALAGVTPLPFDIGATLRDIHTNRLVRVIGISPADGSGRGFDWETIDGNPEKGNCPINSIGCFAIVPDEPAKPEDTATAELADDAERALETAADESPAAEHGTEPAESGTEPPPIESKPAETESPAEPAPVAAAPAPAKTHPPRDRRPPPPKRKAK